MGSWGTALFSNDTASDVRGDFRDRIASGVRPDEAVEALAAEYGVEGDQEIANDFWLAVAVTAHKLGRMTDAMLTAAVRVIEDPTELERWPERSRRQRRTALETARMRLEQPQPAPKRVRASAKVNTALTPGQHLRWSLGDGKADVLLRVLKIHEDN